ncbi:hypothetical protein [Spongiimicrobium sp. 3-5]|uniref:hypothetical protein n=1 Tax=Spongiimicrobium sp. 3-5 TaxID=3332596 RepID=UPI00398184EF
MSNIVNLEYFQKKSWIISIIGIISIILELLQIHVMIIDHLNSKLNDWAHAGMEDLYTIDPKIKRKFNRKRLGQSTVKEFVVTDRDRKNGVQLSLFI